MTRLNNVKREMETGKIPKTQLISGFKRTIVHQIVFYSAIIEAFMKLLLSYAKVKIEVESQIIRKICKIVVTLLELQRGFHKITLGENNQKYF